MWIYDSNFNLSMISIKLKTIKKDFIVSKIEASQDGIPSGIALLIHNPK